MKKLTAGMKLVAGKQIQIVGKGPGVKDEVFEKGTPLTIVAVTTDGQYAVKVGERQMVVTKNWLESHFVVQAESPAVSKETDPKGNQLDTMQDPADHPDPDAEHHAESTRVPSKETDRKGSQVHSMEDPGEHPHSGSGEGDAGTRVEAGKGKREGQGHPAGTGTDGGTLEQPNNMSPTLETEMGGTPPAVERQEDKEEKEKKERAKERTPQGEAASEEVAQETKAKEVVSMLSKVGDIITEFFGLKKGKQPKSKKKSELVLKGMNVTSELLEIAKDIVANAKTVNRNDLLRAFIAVHGPVLGEDMKTNSKKISEAVDLVLADLKKDPEIGSKIQAESQPAPKETDEKGYQGGESSEDPGDSPDPDNAHFEESKRVAPVETEERGYQGGESAKDPGEKPHQGSAAASKVTADEQEQAQKAIDFIMGQLERGVPFDQAKDEAEQKFNTAVPQDQQQLTRTYRKRQRAAMLAAVKGGRRVDAGGYGNPNGNEEEGKLEGNEEEGKPEGNGEEVKPKEDKPPMDESLPAAPAPEDNEAGKKEGFLSRLRGKDRKAAEEALAQAKGEAKIQRERSQRLAKLAEAHQRAAMYWKRQAIDANRAVANRERMDLINSIVRQEVHKGFAKPADAQKRISDLKRKKLPELQAVSETLGRAPVGRRPEYRGKGRNRAKRVAADLSAPETNFRPTLAQGGDDREALEALDDPNFFEGRVPEFHPEG